MVISVLRQSGVTHPAVGMHGGRGRRCRPRSRTRYTPEALGITAILTRPEPFPRTSTATATSAALAMRLLRPRRPVSRPPTWHSSTSTSPVSNERSGLTMPVAACGGWSTPFGSETDRVGVGAAWPKFLAWPSSADRPPRTTGAAPYAFCAAPFPQSPTPDSGTQRIPRLRDQRPATGLAPDNAGTRIPLASGHSNK